MDEAKKLIPGMSSQDFAQMVVDYVPRHVSHSVGGSILFLGYAMAQTGIALFMVILGIEVYFNGYSLAIVQAMIKDHIDQHGSGKPDIQRNNYFLVIERSMGKKSGTMVLIVFMLDVMCCSAFYYKICQELIERLIYSEDITGLEKTGSKIVTMTLVTILLIGTEYGLKYVVSNTSGRTPSVINHRTVHIQADVIGKVSCPARNTDDDDDDREINMQAVKEEMNGFDRKRLIFLLLFIFLLFATISVCYDTYRFRATTGDTSNMTAQCPGLIHPVAWVMGGYYEVIASVAIILYCLKTYAVMLPVCVEEPQTCDPDQYTRLTTWLNITFFAIYLLFPTAVYFTFGESTSPLFVESYGKGTIGTMITTLALSISGTAMLLRIIPIFKLVQVLVTDINTEDFSWLVVVVCTFISLLIAMLVPDVMYIMIFAGSVTSNLLMHIIPSAGYICFKLSTEGICASLGMALCDFYTHIFLLVAGPVAMYLYTTGDIAGCRVAMESQ